MPPELAVVIPVHNEGDNIVALMEEVCAALRGRVSFEIMVVDDQSSDDTPGRLATAAIPELRVIRHRRNAGQSTAVHSGVRFARAPLIATLDGDGQNDPADIPALLDAWQKERHDTPLLIAGQRTDRHDTFVRRASSRIANAVRGRLLRDRTPDTGCGLKLFERDTFLSLPYFDHMHRFLPALVLRAGGRVISVPVHHRARQAGQSHYGIGNRLWTGILDMLGVMWLARRVRHGDGVEEKRGEP